MAKKNPAKLTLDEVKKIAKLANIPLASKQEKRLTEELSSTVDYVSKLSEVETSRITETSQVTGLENVLREDRIDTSRMFSQQEALANAKKSYRGFFVVDRILEEK